MFRWELLRVMGHTKAAQGMIGFVGHGKGDGEGCAISRLAVDTDPASHQVEIFFDNAQAKTGAADA